MQARNYLEYELNSFSMVDKPDNALQLYFQILKTQDKVDEVFESKLLV